MDVPPDVDVYEVELLCIHLAQSVVPFVPYPCDINGWGRDRVFVLPYLTPCPPSAPFNVIESNPELPGSSACRPRSRFPDNDVESVNYALLAFRLV